MASGLGRIWHSLPLIGAEQRWWSAVLTVERIERAERKTLRPQNLVVACGYSQFSFPCRCRCPMLFQNHLGGFGRIRMRSRQHYHRFGSIGSAWLDEVVSRGMDDGPMPKDHPDIECFECLMKGFGACSSCRRWWMSGRGDAGRFGSRLLDRYAVATMLSKK